jgi:uncharacterized protein YaiE (UPF0345 family)
MQFTANMAQRMVVLSFPCALCCALFYTVKESIVSTSLNQVSITPIANVYFDGKCVSHSIIDADGNKKSVGVILPSTLTFNVGVPEIMELLQGKGRVQVNDGDWQAIEGAMTFSVPENGQFVIEVTEAVHYICHFG